MMLAPTKEKPRRKTDRVETDYLIPADVGLLGPDTTAKPHYVTLANPQAFGNKDLQTVATHSDQPVTANTISDICPNTPPEENLKTLPLY